MFLCVRLDRGFVRMPNACTLIVMSGSISECMAPSEHVDADYMRQNL